MDKALLLLSGGADSSTLLYDLINQGKTVIALTFDFGEREGSNEMVAASRICELLGVEHHHYDLSVFTRDFYQLPYPQYLRKGMTTVTAVEKSDSVQPFGSSIALILAASWAVKNDISDVYYAVHANDAQYPDNHPSYFDALSRVTSECEGEQYRIRFHTPYLSRTKSEVIAHGTSLGVPYEVTWSCARGGDQPCGTCDACIDRRMSFQLAGVEDCSLKAETVDS